MSRAYNLISADSHIEVPPDIWSKGVPDPFKDIAPKRIVLPNGGDGFLVEGGIYQGGSNLYAGKTPEEYNPIGLKWIDMAGTGDGHQRLEEMDMDGVDAEVLYPGVGGVLNMTRRIRNDDAYHALIRTYNRWLVEEYCAPDPDRLIGVGCIPSRGLDQALDELELAAEAGLKVVALSKFPTGKDYPSPEDDRFWAAAIGLDMPVTVHVSFPKPRDQAFVYPYFPPRHLRPPDYVTRLARYGIRGALTVVQMVMSGLFDRFPSLEIYFAESQIGWVPIYLEQLDHNYRRHRYWAEKIYRLKPLGQLPSEYIKGHILWGFFNDPIGVKVRHDVGVDNIIWGGDFPHVESEWPNSVKLLDSQLKGVPADERRKMVAGNAARFLRLEP
ncbi:MAG: amidohydrolase family protein [Alphaproteobacteria bacterium]